MKKTKNKQKLIPFLKKTYFKKEINPVKTFLKTKSKINLISSLNLTSDFAKFLFYRERKTYVFSNKKTLNISMIAHKLTRKTLNIRKMRLFCLNNLTNKFN